MQIKKALLCSAIAAILSSPAAFSADLSQRFIDEGNGGLGNKFGAHVSLSDSYMAIAESGPLVNLYKKSPSSHTWLYLTSVERASGQDLVTTYDQGAKPFEMNDDWFVASFSDRVEIYGRDTGGADNWGLKQTLNIQSEKNTLTNPIHLDGNTLLVGSQRYGFDGTWQAIGSSDLAQASVLKDRIVGLQDGQVMVEGAGALTALGENIVAIDTDNRRGNLAVYRSSSGVHTVQVYQASGEGLDNLSLLAAVNVEDPRPGIYSEYPVHLNLEGDRALLLGPMTNRGPLSDADQNECVTEIKLDAKTAESLGCFDDSDLSSTSLVVSNDTATHPPETDTDYKQGVVTVSDGQGTTQALSSIRGASENRLGSLIASSGDYVVALTQSYRSDVTAANADGETLLTFKQKGDAYEKVSDQDLLTETVAYEGRYIHDAAMSDDRLVIVSRSEDYDWAPGLARIDTFVRSGDAWDEVSSARIEDIEEYFGFGFGGLALNNKHLAYPTANGLLVHRWDASGWSQIAKLALPGNARYDAVDFEDDAIVLSDGNELRTFEVTDDAYIDRGVLTVNHNSMVYQDNTLYVADAAAGKVYVYERDDSFSWHLITTVTSPSGGPAFGTALAVKEGLLAVTGENTASQRVVNLFSKNLNGDHSYALFDTAVAPNQADSSFGDELHLANERLVVGSPLLDTQWGHDAGAVYFYQHLAITANQAPIFLSEPVINAVVDTDYRYALQAGDAESDPLSVSMVTGPSWLRIDGFALVGMPTSADIGAHAVTLRLTDGRDHETQSFEVVVSASDSGLSNDTDTTSEDEGNTNDDQANSSGSSGGVVWGLMPLLALFRRRVE